MSTQVADRRRFLTSVFGLGAAAAVGRASPGEGAQPPANPATAALGRIPEDRYITLGRTAVRVSPVAAGLALKAEDLVASADAGINYFDTAEKYLNGQHNRMVGEALKGRPRDRIFVSAKFQDGLQNELTATTQQIVTRVYQCLERMGTTYADCMLIHNVQRPEALDNPEWLRAYERLKADGKVRFLGASTHDPKLVPILARAIESSRYDLLLLAYNPTTGGDLYGSPGWPEMLRLLEQARAKNIAVATMKIMVGAVAANAVTGVGKDGIDPNDIVGRGKYLDARVAATRWVLSNPAVHVVQYHDDRPRDRGRRRSRRDHAVRGQGRRRCLCVPACGERERLSDSMRRSLSKRVPRWRADRGCAPPPDVLRAFWAAEAGIDRIRGPAVSDPRCRLSDVLRARPARTPATSVVRLRLSCRTLIDF